MVRLGALSGRGEVLIGGIPHGQVHYAIEECHQGGLGGRRGQITGDDQLLRAIWTRPSKCSWRVPRGRSRSP